MAQNDSFSEKVWFSRWFLEEGQRRIISVVFRLNLGSCIAVRFTLHKEDLSVLNTSERESFLFYWSTFFHELRHIFDLYYSHSGLFDFLYESPNRDSCPRSKNRADA